MRLSSILFIAAIAACGGGSKPAEKPATLGEQHATNEQSQAQAEKKKEEPPPPPKKQMIGKAASELEWKPLDEKAGDKGPMFASVWGDMQSEPNGFFIKLPKGNPGALHTHTSDYHAIEIAGNASNAQDGQKKAAPLPPQSYWFQPGGLAHTTACDKKADCIAYVEVMGKFDYAPAKPVKGAKPDPRYVEKRLKDLKWQPLDPKNPKGPTFAPLWGDSQSEPNGFLLKLKAGSEPFWHTHKNDYHGVVLAGTINNIESGTEPPKDLPVGSYWMQPAGNKHTTNCKAGADCVVYLHFEGAFDVVPAK